MSAGPGDERHAGMTAAPRALSILCPVFNEAVVIPLFFARMKPVIDRLALRYDVRLIFLNNGSTDDSLGVIHRLIDENPDIYVLTMSRNVGYQRSIEQGVRAVLSDIYTIIDVDCEDPPEMIEDFAGLIEGGCHVAYGQRVDREEPRLIKKARHVFYRLLKAFADEDIILDMAEFSMFTREIREAIIMENSSFPFLRASIARVGFQRTGIPFKRQRRIAGTSHYNFFSMSLFAIGGILASSTLLLRLPIYALPFWLLALAITTGLYASTASLWYFAAAFLLTASYLGATAAATALYVARTYKNGLVRPNSFVDRGRSILPPDMALERPQVLA